jgi:hypothetical protein
MDALTTNVAAENADAEAVAEGELVKKERVLHTRVPVMLERELKRFAEGLRVPVSNLVRTILEDAVKAADFATESVEGKLKRAAEQIEQERERFGERLRRRGTKEALVGVYAFQAVKLARPAHCAKCDRDLAAGDDAFLGLMDPAQEPGVRVFACTACLEKS